MRDQVQKLAFELQVRGLMNVQFRGERQRSLPD
ncbi:Carbamoyl-phosphate synthase large chain [Leclercia adecarboxylata]|uniref:Carbamoyl-phosphate synthase large chain n=1 Tax=Leclercia adecarboxylata TaxID=83655 RepID=A0A4U9HKH4_9ENTR|nr:Carbamoyl-phosphate synthase large chain [Leclercia adecarboxylata]